MIETVTEWGQTMSERSTAMGVALLLAPNLCVVSIRFGLPVLNDIISEDPVLELGIHSAATILGLLMFLRYRRVEDHEYHRSKIIRGLSKTYKSEDRGLWGDKSDRALEKLEANSSNISTKSSRKSRDRMSGTVGSINTEMSETEVGEEFEADVRVSGIQTIVDEEKVREESSKNRTSILSFFGSIMDSSARRRLEREKAKAERKKAKAERKKAKAERKKESMPGNEWDAPATSSMARSVVSCKNCGNLNNSSVQYCSSCGDFLA
jgi:hypothetical protein